MIRNRYIKEYLGYDYSSFNHGNSSSQAKRNRRLGTHKIRSKQKRELRELIEENELDNGS